MPHVRLLRPGRVLRAYESGTEFAVFLEQWYLLLLGEAAPCHRICGSPRESPLGLERLSGAFRRIEAANQTRNAGPR